LHGVSDILVRLEELLVEVFAPGSEAEDEDEDEAKEMRDLWISNNVCELYTILAGMELVLQLTGPPPTRSPPGPSIQVDMGSLSAEQLGAVKQVYSLLPAVVANIDRAGVLRSLEPKNLCACCMKGVPGVVMTASPPPPSLPRTVLVILLFVLLFRLWPFPSLTRRMRALG
jgi:hypothetical protein